MLKQICMVLVVLVMAFPLSAEEIHSQAASPGFQGLRFGQPPFENMVCIEGSCPSIQEEKIINKNKSLISTYLQPKDITHYNFIEISSPKYDFWENRFVQVKFKLMCDPEKAEFCIDTVCDELNRQNAITFIKELSEPISSQDEVKIRLYRTESGEIVEIRRHKRRDTWNPPVVKIYNKELMDKVRLDANPDYVSYQIKN